MEDSGDPGAGPSTSRPRNQATDSGSQVSWDLPSDLTMLIAELLTAEHSPFWDDSDVARDAASLACAGRPMFTELAQHLFTFISPRYGEDPGVTESSGLPAMKQVLKAWGLPIGGKKSELWERIADEVEGDDEPGDAPCCPVSRATKKRVRELHSARVTKHALKEKWGVSPYDLYRLPSTAAALAAAGEAQTYALRDVKMVARNRHGTHEQFLASHARSKASSKAFMESYRNHREARSNLVVQVLIARGEDEPLAQRAVGHLWYLDFFSFRSGAIHVGPEVEAETERVADKAEAWLFYVMHTRFPDVLAHMKQGHAYLKGKAQYKQDVELEQRAFGQALQSFVAARSLQQVLQHPGLPAHMQAEAQRTWEHMQQARQR